MKDGVMKNVFVTKSTAGMVGRNNGFANHIDTTKTAITASTLQNVNIDKARTLAMVKNKTSAEIISETKSMLANGKCFCLV